LLGNALDRTVKAWRATAKSAEATKFGSAPLSARRLRTRRSPFLILPQRLCQQEQANCQRSHPCSEKTKTNRHTVG
jgi:hypothetical protein